MKTTDYKVQLFIHGRWKDLDIDKESLKRARARFKNLSDLSPDYKYRLVKQVTEDISK